MTVYAFVPSRGGSVRIPNKNLAMVHGASLVWRAVVAAWQADCTEVVVSTDCPDISGEVGRLAGVYGFLPTSIHERSPEHATAHAQIEPAIDHWMHQRDPVLDDGDVIVLLHPTSPFRRPETIRRCVELVQSGYDSALTVTLDSRRTGHWLGGVAIWTTEPGVRPRSQDVKGRPVENGCVYAMSVRHFRKTGLRMGGHEATVPVSWLESFEIDDPIELEIARAIAEVADGLG